MDCLDMPVDKGKARRFVMAITHFLEAGIADMHRVFINDVPLSVRPSILSAPGIGILAGPPVIASPRVLAPVTNLRTISESDRRARMVESRIGVGRIYQRAPVHRADMRVHAVVEGAGNAGRTPADLRIHGEAVPGRARARLDVRRDFEIPVAGAVRLRAPDREPGLIVVL